MREQRAEQRAARPNVPDIDQQIMAQVQMAMHMNEMETRMQERQMMMMALHHGAGANQAAAEEERLLQRAIEESKRE